MHVGSSLFTSHVCSWTCTRMHAELRWSNKETHTHILSGPLLTAQPRAHKLTRTHTPSLLSTSHEYTSWLPQLGSGTGDRSLQTRRFCVWTAFSPWLTLALMLAGSKGAMCSRSQAILNGGPPRAAAWFSLPRRGLYSACLTYRSGRSIPPTQCQSVFVSLCQLLPFYPSVFKAQIWRWSWVLMCLIGLVCSFNSFWNAFFWLNFGTEKGATLLLVVTLPVNKKQIIR